MMAAMNSIWGGLAPSVAGGAGAAATTPLASAAVPRAVPGLGAVDVHEGARAYTISMDAPGVPKDAVDITVADGLLTVAGHRSEEKTEGGEGKEGPVVRERVWGSFSRSFRVPADADVDGIKASMDHGVLKLVVPRKEEAEPAKKKVAIE
jgi:HSP20 family protein